MKFTAALALAMSLSYATEQYGDHKVGIEDLLYDDAKDDYRPYGGVHGGHHGPSHGGYSHQPHQPDPSPSYTVHAKCMLKDPEEENYLGGTINFVEQPYGDL